MLDPELPRLTAVNNQKLASSASSRSFRTCLEHYLVVIKALSDGAHTALMGQAQNCRMTDASRSLRQNRHPAGAEILAHMENRELGCTMMNTVLD